MAGQWRERNGISPTSRTLLLLNPLNKIAMPPENYYERRRAEQDRIINDYLEYCKAREKEAGEEIVTLEARTLLEIEFVFNLN
jgi:hypothetical protein